MITLVMVGLYSVYEIFYSPYFNHLEVVQLAFEGNRIPSKAEIVFSQFRNFKTVIICLTASILIVYGKAKFKGKTKT